MFKIAKHSTTTLIMSMGWNKDQRRSVNVEMALNNNERGVKQDKSSTRREAQPKRFGG